eukprot:5418383-Pleurochrysis_carterae.AAC.1
MASSGRRQTGGRRRCCIEAGPREGSCQSSRSRSLVRAKREVALRGGEGVGGERGGKRRRSHASECALNVQGCPCMQVVASALALVIGFADVRIYSGRRISESKRRWNNEQRGEEVLVDGELREMCVSKEAW